MRSQESNLIRRAIALLQMLAPHDEPDAIDLPSRRCPVVKFAKQYLTFQPGSDMSTAELFQFYAEIACSGELDRISKSEFLRRLPIVLEITFGVRKSHGIQRSGSRVRGFKGITVSEHTSPVTTLELDPE